MDKQKRKLLMLKSISLTDYYLHYLSEVEKYGILKGKMRTSLKTVLKDLEKTLKLAEGVVENDVEAKEELEEYKKNSRIILDKIYNYEK